MDTRILLLGLAVRGTWVLSKMRRGILVPDAPVLTSHSMAGGRIMMMVRCKGKRCWTRPRGITLCPLWECSYYMPACGWDGLSMWQLRKSGKECSSSRSAEPRARVWQRSNGDAWSSWKFGRIKQECINFESLESFPFQCSRFWVSDLHTAAWSVF